MYTIYKSLEGPLWLRADLKPNTTDMSVSPIIHPSCLRFQTPMQLRVYTEQFAIFSWICYPNTSGSQCFTGLRPNDRCTS